jgi:hypothetical protein
VRSQRNTRSENVAKCASQAYSALRFGHLIASEPFAQFEVDFAIAGQADRDIWKIAVSRPKEGNPPGKRWLGIQK